IIKHLLYLSYHIRAIRSQQCAYTRYQAIILSFMDSTALAASSLFQRDAPFEIAPQQVERRQYSKAFVIRATGTPTRSHDACHAIWPLNGNMHGADGLLFLLVGTRYACNPYAKICPELLTYRVSHRARSLFTYRAMRF